MKKKIIKARSGSILIRISNVFYEVPENVVLFKSPNGEDCYLSGINYLKQGFNDKTTCLVKYIVKNEFKIIPYKIVEGHISNEYKKLLFYDEEYDVPLQFVEQIKLEFKNIKKYDIKAKKDFLNEYEKYKSNK